MKLAERMNRIGIEKAFEVLVRARQLEAQGRSVIHLEIGEPDFPTPGHIIEAAKQALDEAGVACVNGADFGAYGEGYIRFSYANSFENLLEAVDRMREFLRSRPTGAHHSAKE